MADHRASLWEVTHLIMQNPDRCPAEIAEAHGFSAAEITELLPLFLDNLSVDFTRLAGRTVPDAERAPDESPEDFLDRYLRALGDHAQPRPVAGGGPDTQVTVPNGVAPVDDADGPKPAAAFGAGADQGLPAPVRDAEHRVVGPDRDDPEPVRLDDPDDLAGTGPESGALPAGAEIPHPDGADEVGDSDFQFD